MPSIADIRAQLKLDAQIQDSEGITHAMLDSYISDALKEHNAAYTIDTLPVKEVELVKILAWVRVCLTRASNAVNLSDLSGTQGYGQDRNTPYRKNIDMAASLKERYAELAPRLTQATIVPEGVVVVSSVHLSAPEIDAPVPFNPPVLPPLPVLTVTTPTATEAVLSWTVQSFSFFAEFIIVALNHDTDSLLQEWNFNSVSTIPKIHDSAQILYRSYTPSLRSIKVTSLDRATKLRFAVVVRSQTNEYTVSNECVLNVVT